MMILKFSEKNSKTFPKLENSISVLPAREISLDASIRIESESKKNILIG